MTYEEIEAENFFLVTETRRASARKIIEQEGILEPEVKNELI